MIAENIENQKLGIIVDATNLIHVLYKAGPGNVVSQLFARQLAMLDKTYNPSWMIAAFDGDRCFRHDVAQDYKGQRPEKEANLIQSLKLGREAASKGGWLVAEESGFEADDILASCAKHIGMMGHKALLVSRDKDLNQCLVAGHVSIAKKIGVGGVEQFLTADDLKTEFELFPEQWSDYQALVGDSTDNITGCPGIGKQTAIKLLNSAGSLKQLLAMPEIAPTKRLVDNLTRFSSRAEQVQRLVRLRNDIDVSPYFM